jgi:hypothetical protein
MLFDLATAWLVEHQAPLTGVSILARLITRVRERATPTRPDFGTCA